MKVLARFIATLDQYTNQRTEKCFKSIADTKTHPRPQVVA